MVLNIKNPEADRLARELAGRSADEIIGYDEHGLPC